MAKKTPPMYVRGRFILKAPWVAISTMVYKVIAVRALKDLYEDGLDPYKDIYLANGLIDGQPYDDYTFNYQNELNELANVITLYGDDGSLIYVPDTYILSYPNMGDIPYNHIILSISCGALADYIDLGPLKTQITDIAMATTGISVEVLENRAPSVNTPTPEEHEVIETGRLAAITNMETDFARANRLQTQVDELLVINQSLVQTLIDEGIIP